MRSKGQLIFMRKLGSVERRAIQLLSEATDISPPIRQRAKAILLAELGIQPSTIAALVAMPVKEVTVCLDSFEAQGMHALYDSPSSFSPD
jgi:hypothetical protein